MVWHLPSTVKDLHIANFHWDWLADRFRSILLHRNLRYGKDFEIPNMTLTLTHYWSLSAASIVNLVIIVASPVRISVFSVVHRTINFSLNFLLHDYVELRFLGGSYVGFYRSTEPLKCQCISLDYNVSCIVVVGHESSFRYDPRSIGGATERR